VLRSHLGRPVTLDADTVGPSARSAVAPYGPAALVMLESLRFNPDETSKGGGIHSLMSWRPWPTCTSVTGSGRCTAIMPASMASRRGCPRRRVPCPAGTAAPQG
jgi:hypothetical protein